MKNTLVTIFMTVLFVAIGSDVHACASPKTGYFWDKDELIENAKTIVVVEIEKQTAKISDIDDDAYAVDYNNALKVVEVIKGSVSEPLVLYSNVLYSGTVDAHLGAVEHYKNSGTDFNRHHDSDFWMEGMGRSSQKGFRGPGDCGPPHIFVEGERYLYFPDANGAVKSAELIKSKDDEWYQYVKQRVATLQKDLAQVETVQKESAQVGVLQTDPSCSGRQN